MHFRAFRYRDDSFSSAMLKYGKEDSYSNYGYSEERWIVMAVPTFSQFLKPLLVILGDGQEHKLKELCDKMADHFQLTEADRQELIHSRKQTVLYNRVCWGCTYLKKAGLILYVKRGVFLITDAGKDVIKENPPTIDRKYLSRFKSFAEFSKITPDSHSKDVTIPGDSGENDKLTPDEQMEEAYNQINQELADNILDEVLKMKEKPTIFEQFVVDLLEQMGYGTMGFGSHTTKASGDDGIDGVIMQDKLGFSLIYMQAKCWDKTSTVGQPEIQKFLGAIYGKHGDGLFVTTAKFSQKAMDYAHSNHIILIDGEKLAHLMIEYNFCVSVRKTFQIKAIDTDALNEYMEE